eukprot:2188488-Pyramimonas_sp.AAC.2
MKFRFYITTNLRNPHYLPEVHSKFTLRYQTVTLSVMTPPCGLALQAHITVSKGVLFTLPVHSPCSLSLCTLPVHSPLSVTTLPCGLTLPAHTTVSKGDTKRHNAQRVG